MTKVLLMSKRQKCGENAEASMSGRFVMRSGRAWVCREQHADALDGYIRYLYLGLYISREPYLCYEFVYMWHF
jgi:hypothetical protein